MNAKRTILIVDDDLKVRKTLSDILGVRGYVPIAAATGKAALDRVEEKLPTVALIDLKLEDISGLEVMRGIKKRSPGTECIVLTGYATQKSAIEAVNLGAYSYMQKPYDMEQLLVTVRRAIERREAEEALRESEEKYRTILENIEEGYYEVDIAGNFTFFNDPLCRILGYPEDELLGMNNRQYMDHESAKQVYRAFNEVYRTGKPARAFDWEVIRKDGTRRFVESSLSLIRGSTGELSGFRGIVRDITERKRAEEELQHTMKKLREALGGIIQTVALTVETKDPYTAGHQRRVGNLARAIATELGLSPEQIEGIRMAGGIHDLGKVGVPAEILSWPGPLSDLQLGLIKMHSQIGYDVLKTVEFPWPVAQIVLQHHERLDGSGYPQGLSGEEILLEARILAVADVVEAMASRRPYRPPRGLDKALEEISQNRGVLYDPEAVDACLKLFTEKGFVFE